jgi:hypothetical protein
MKMDIARVFDSVDWPFLLEILRYMGFRHCWLNWVSVLLASASTKVLLNGCPGRRICHTRGLRQGDPLSLFLFILVMEVLGAMIIKADECGLFEPLGVRAIPFRASLCADDVVLFISPKVLDLQLLHQIFAIFAGASGLQCNVNKCQMAVIRCDDSQKEAAAQAFPCQQVEFLIKYLGIPLSTGRLPRSALQPLLDKAADKLPIWKGSMMHHAGRLALVKSTLSVVPIYTSICMGLPAWMYKGLTKLAKAFLWTGTDVVQAGKCLVAWDKIQWPLQLGGLGVLDMEKMGRALRMRWLWHQRVHLDKPWANLPCKEDSITTSFFMASIQCRVGERDLNSVLVRPLAQWSLYRAAGAGALRSADG